MSIPLSVLDLVPVPSGGTSTEAFGRIAELAREVERLGYVRYWFAEHHGMPYVASTVPEVLIAHVASATKRIRVGAGGMMLPHHTSLRVAEAFHSLEALYPNRIDLGLGRAPVTDPGLVAALRPTDPERFPEQVEELVALSPGTFAAGHPLAGVRALPEGVALPPVWLLGTSGGTAELAAQLGVGYAVATHLGPVPPAPAAKAYRASFRPGEAFPRPHLIVTVSAVVGETHEEAASLATSMEAAWVRLQRGEFLTLPNPQEAREEIGTAEERAIATAYRRLQIVGTPARVGDRIRALVAETQADEVMVRTLVHDHTARLRSYELLMRELS